MYTFVWEKSAIINIVQQSLKIPDVAQHIKVWIMAEQNEVPSGRQNA